MNTALLSSFKGFVCAKTLEEAMMYKKLARQDIKNWKEVSE